MRLDALCCTFRVWDFVAGCWCFLWGVVSFPFLRVHVFCCIICLWDVSCFLDRRGICLWEFMLCAAYEMSVWAFMLVDPKESCLWDVMLFSWKSNHVTRLPLWEFKLVWRNKICLWDFMFFSCILFLRDFMVLGCYELFVWDVMLVERYEISGDHLMRVDDFEMVYEMSLWEVVVVCCIIPSPDEIWRRLQCCFRTRFSFEILYVFCCPIFM